ncbi:voltage-dependent T-type calcium channel subunit alpha-1H-like [Oppia nitens]|uniref:voltage-dependent T-type calcium channel subunit alpha-1H-like n=1 Tax=Oppia nitens TaxID=1686743 RepID=UPI0023DA9BC7|nr:voltage-dependent T-type calcium channel subunit alpha-1H-like [Oppia nitens]
MLRSSKQRYYYDETAIEMGYISKHSDTGIDKIEESTIYSCDINEETQEVDSNERSGGKVYKYKRSSSCCVDDSPIERRLKLLSKSDGNNGNNYRNSQSFNNSNEELPYPEYVSVSLFCMKQTSPPRNWCLTMISNPWFERISMIAILLNCVTLGMYQPCNDEYCTTSRCKALQVFDDIIFAFFTIEMIIKMTAMGITGSKGAYLSDTWNRLDCFIVVAGALEYCLDVGNMNLSAIRTVRVLRPLRAINRIPSMRILVMLLLDTLPMLGNVLMLCFFVFFIFGIIGVQLWAGLLRQRCHLVLPTNVSLPRYDISQIYVERVKVLHPIASYYQNPDADKDYICSADKDNGMHRCVDLLPSRYYHLKCSDRAQQFSGNEPNDTNCVNWNQYYTECKAGDKNPFQDAISFDNVGMAWTTIFLVISLEGWSDIMYYVQDAHSFWDWIYFVLLIVIGSFFMINLCLVVIATQFSETKKREMERMRQERARCHSQSTLASYSASEPNNCYAALIKYLAHLWRKSRRTTIRWYRQRRKTKELSSTIDMSTAFNPLNPMNEVSHAIALGSKRLHKRSSKKTKRKYKGPKTKRCDKTCAKLISHSPQTTSARITKCVISEASVLPAPAPRASPEISDIDVNYSPAKNNEVNAELTSTAIKDKTNKGLNKSSIKYCLNREEIRDNSLAHQNYIQTIDCVKSNEMSDNQTLKTFHLSASKSGRHCSAPTLLFLRPTPSPTFVTLKGELQSITETVTSQSDTNQWSKSEGSWDDDIDDQNDSQLKDRSRCVRFWSAVQSVLKIIVNHNYFKRAIFLSILFNTICMGIEYHNQPESLTQTVEISNVIFTAIFGFEMVLKLSADGFYNYISSGFNVFDGSIVLLSLLELLEEHGSGLSVLRSFRLLRILKLVRFMPALRRQLVIMLRTIDNVAVFFALLLLFIFIFSILGMNLFGCKFCRKTPENTIQCDRKNFDSLLWALVTVFQILTQEDWNVVLFNGMERTSPYAALYFVALMTFGNYVLFNLLVAILVEGFSHTDERKESETDEDSQEGEVKREKLIYFYGPQDNLEREMQLLSNLSNTGYEMSTNTSIKAQNHDNNNKDVLLGIPPLITHTAATPQGSPNATLEPNRSFQLSPLSLQIQAASLCSINQSFDDTSLCSANNAIASLSVPSSHLLPSNLQRRRSSCNSSINIDSLNSIQDSLRSSCISTDNKGNVLRIQRHGSNISRKSSKKKKKLDKQTLVDDNNSSDSDNDVFDKRYALHESTTEVDVNNQCNGDVSVLINDNNKRCSITSTKESVTNRHNSVGCNSTLSPDDSIKSFMSIERKNSLIHEIRVLSPRNSLTGVFYSSSVISVKNPSMNSSFKLDEIPVTLAESFKDDALLGAPYQAISDANTCDPYLMQNSSRKFCVYFDWTEWMSQREEYSLFIFPIDNKYRQQCIAIADNTYFDYVVLLFISLNCITLAMERPKIPPWSAEREFLGIANYAFTAIFALEMMIKVAAKGLYYGKDAYFKNGWNIMDGILVGVSLFDIVLSFFAQKTPRILGILRVFRLLRSLRPLRVINRAPGLKLVVQTLLSSLRPIGNIVLICCTFFIIFGILGVQLFKGSLYYCEGPKAKNVRNKTECMSDPRNRWINRKYNFDNLGQALMSLFVLSSKDGWVNIMYTGLDAVGVDQQPIENYNEWRLLYFISFLLLVAFFVLNMFVGVVVENFHRCREEQEKEEKAFRAAKRARKLEKRRKKMREPPYFIGYGNYRLFVHKIVTGKYFDLIIAAVIGLNVITMSLEHYFMPVGLVYTLKIFNFVFTGVFVIEAIMKAMALGVRRYLKDKWNQLDVIIVMLSILGIILEEMESTLIPINPTIIRVMRVMRIARVLKLLKMAKGIRQLLDTVMQALPQVGNLGLLFFLLFFIFSALGTELFGRLECDEDNPCQGLGEHAHFQNFGMAFLTLFRVATGDNWNGIMKDTLRDKCDPTEDCLINCCISPIIAPLYFVVFVLMAQFVLVNVVIAVLMKHLEESHTHDDDDEDEEIDLEIAKEMEAEKKAIKDAIDRQQRERKLNIRRPLMKMASLPNNFVFTCETIDLDNNYQHNNNPMISISRSSEANSESYNQNRTPVITIEDDGQELVANISEVSSDLLIPKHVYRKFSDFMDEESATLTHCLQPSYPEFAKDSDQQSLDSVTWSADDSLSSKSSLN